MFALFALLLVSSFVVCVYPKLVPVKADHRQHTQKLGRWLGSTGSGCKLGR